MTAPQCPSIDPESRRRCDRAAGHPGDHVSPRRIGKTGFSRYWKDPAPMTQTPDSAPQALPHEALLALATGSAQIVEALTTYRGSLEAAGFSPAAAETMTVDFHRVILDASVSAQTGKA